MPNRPYLILAVLAVLAVAAFLMTKGKDYAADLARAQLGHFVNLVDTNKDGKLSKEEMNAFFTAIDLNHDDGVTEDEIAAFIRKSRGELLRTTPGK